MTKVFTGVVNLFAEPTVLKKDEERAWTVQPQAVFRLSYVATSPFFHDDLLITQIEIAGEKLLFGPFTPEQLRTHYRLMGSSFPTATTGISVTFRAKNALKIDAAALLGVMVLEDAET